MSEPLTFGLVGFGNHVRKNLLRLFDGPAGPRLARIHVRDAAHYGALYPDYAARFAGIYDALLADPGIDAIYVATPIASHAMLARLALFAGKHVLCEKPLTWHLHEAEELAALARLRGLLLAEVAMYRHHAQFAQVQALLAERATAGERLLGLRARFAIPELPTGDIRYQAAQGGGALLDLGYYPLSAAVALLGEPDDVAATGFFDRARGVDLSGEALLRFGGTGAHCSWAIGAAYANELALHFERHDYLVERAFSKPPELATSIAVREANGQPGAPIAVPADDQFANFLAAQTAAIRSGDTAGFAVTADAALLGLRTIDRVRQAMRFT